MSPDRFYDELAEYYDLIYPEWDRAMARHGEAIAQMLEPIGRVSTDGGTRVLDVSAGIGTQSLPLAELGFDVTARDLSASSVARLRREASSRGLDIDAGVADMRSVSKTVDGTFEAVVAFDNAVPHLLNDDEILRALREFRRVLEPGGMLLVSLRDYDGVDRAPTSYHPYGDRHREGQTFRLGQEWEWLGPDHYRTTLVIEAVDETTREELLRSATEYYAISPTRVAELILEAGFESCEMTDVPFFQPVLIGRREAASLGPGPSSS